MWLLGHSGVFDLITQGAALYIVSKSTDPQSGHGIRFSALSDMDAEILYSFSQLRQRKSQNGISLSVLPSVIIPVPFESRKRRKKRK